MELTFKDFSIFSSGGHLVYWSGTVLAILLGSLLCNIPIFSSGGHFVHRSITILALLLKGHLTNIPMKFK